VSGGLGRRSVYVVRVIVSGVGFGTICGRGGLVKIDENAKEMGDHACQTCSHSPYSHRQWTTRMSVPMMQQFAECRYCDCPQYSGAYGRRDVEEVAW
jgi:hypothetical protein